VWPVHCKEPIACRFGNSLPSLQLTIGDCETPRCALAPILSTRLCVLMNGLSFEIPGMTTEDLRPLLDARCKNIDEQRLVHDCGAKWKT
jgi:hypothetical protein